MAETRGPIKVEQRKVADLVPFARNSRTHSEAQIEQIAASIREFGWTNPILVDAENGILAGHGRLSAAKRLGMASVPVIVLSGLSEAQRRALVIADNQLAANAGWDEDLLAAELEALGAEGFDLSLLGFDEGALAELLADKTEGRTDPDDVPDVPDEPVSRLGDVWILGRHRLVCGDSTDADTVAKCLNGVAPHLMVTDPPYGVEYDANWRNEADRANGKPYGARAVGKVANDERADWTEAWTLFPGDVAYCWHAGRHASEVQRSLEQAGFSMRSQIIWAKDRLIISRGDYHWQHEPCWYAVRKGRKGHYAGGRSQTTLWQIAHAKSETGHSTQKPVECMKRPIENNSSPGQAVYDPFVGSGTTIIAAEMTGRACFAIELSPAYVDVCVKRWQEFTGEEAVHEDGRKFNDLVPLQEAA
jgi:DNA modification methylase